MKQMLHQFRTRHCRRDGGFTLVELLAVIIIVGVLAAVIVPSMSNAESSRSASAARVLYHDVLYARQHAMVSGRTTWVIVDAAANSWSLQAESFEAPGRFDLLDSQTGHPMVGNLNAEEWAGVTIVSASFNGAAEIGFDWLGRPLDSASDALAMSGTIVLSGGAVVSVQPGTGFVVLSMP